MKLLCFGLLLVATVTNANKRYGYPHHRYYEGTGELYDPATQKCCRGVSFPRMRNNYILCCGNSTYDITEQMCCNGVPLPLSAGTRTACCGTMTYDIKASLCCMGRVAKLPKGTSTDDLEHFECRGTKAIDTRNASENELEPQEKDEGVSAFAADTSFYPAPQPPPMPNTCNGIKFNRTTQMCCNNTEIKESSMPNAACCGDNKPYDNKKQICCRSPEGDWKLSDKPRVSHYSSYYGMDASCCGGVGYDYTTEICCNQTVHKIPEGGQRWEFQCCGSGIIDTNIHSCCDGENAIEKKTESEGCCGNKTYSYQSQLCCYHNMETKVFDKEDGHRSQCCAGEQYNTRSHLCCYDFRSTDGFMEHLLEKPTSRSQCCGNSTYDPTKEICCGSTVAAMDDGSTRQQCCGENVYNPDTHTCCDQRTMEITDPAKQSCCSIYTSDDYSYRIGCYGMNRPNDYPYGPPIFHTMARGGSEKSSESSEETTTLGSETTEADTAK